MDKTNLAGHYSSSDPFNAHMNSLSSLAQQNKCRVLMVASEAVPFIKTGGLGDVIGTLPLALQKIGYHMSVALPCYSDIPKHFLGKMEFLKSITVSMSDKSIPTDIMKLKHNDISFYFVKNDDMFFRDSGIYGYQDDNYRFVYFCKALCEAIIACPEMNCNIIHGNDWQSSMISVYLRTLYSKDYFLKDIKTVFSIHNALFQGIGGEDQVKTVLGLHDYPAAEALCCMDDGRVNLMRVALACSDIITTVSHTYANEIQCDSYGAGLESAFRRRKNNLVGILNGIDQNEWNPQDDSYIPATFDATNLAGKQECKLALQKEAGLRVSADIPLLAMVSRLTSQKGLDLICEIIPYFVKQNVELLILGTGDEEYEKKLSSFSKKYPDLVQASLSFDVPYSHRIYAGSDMLLMPSSFEPCGLSQMIAMRYGTLPVVHATGGLKDSVLPYNKSTGEGTGFVFENYSAHELQDTLTIACKLYRNSRDEWNKLINNALQVDFSWDLAARGYAHIYKTL